MGRRSANIRRVGVRDRAGNDDGRATGPFGHRFFWCNAAYQQKDGFNAEAFS
jgi:hypothetical protein